MIKQNTISKYIDRVTSARCVVFDMDATLCVHESQMGFWDCDKFAPNPPIVEMAQMLKRQGYDIVIALPAVIDGRKNCAMLHEACR
jgi:hypothetical protein